MGVRWLYDNKLVHEGIGTVERVRDYSIGKYWGPHDVGNTLYFDFGTGIKLDAFAILTGDASNGTAFISYSHDGTLYEGTTLVDIIYGTGNSFFNIGTHRYWKIGKHWLVALRNLLARPFGYQVVMVLGRL